MTRRGLAVLAPMIRMGRLEDLGLSGEALSQFEEALMRPTGIVLVSGPPHSGKTTTLYSCLARLNTESRSLMTAERPVHAHMDGISQTEIVDGEPMGFHEWIYAALQLDPDVVMVSELPDAQSLAFAMRAARRTLLLAEVTAESSTQALLGLMDLGTSAFALTLLVTCVTHQRLVRRLCPHCRRETAFPAEKFTKQSWLQSLARPLKAYEPVGCEHCGGTGYAGLTALFEVSRIGKSVGDVLGSSASRERLLRAGKSQTTMALVQDGLRKIEIGITSVQEVLAAVRDESAADDQAE
jgi:type II secretory ATPase GspE/PulE/Tfp pilus assembly ATPase PilB-like protein